MTFTWGPGVGTTLDLSGSNAASSISGVLEQGGSILRTITGNGVSNRVWSKWAWSFSWNMAPEEVATKLEAMKLYDGNVVLEDSVVGTYTCSLTDDSLRIDKTAWGICSAQATFREA